MKELIIVADWYDGKKELLYRGTTLKQAKKAIRDRVDDTSGECDLTVNALIVYDSGCIVQREWLTQQLLEYYENYTESVLAEL